MARAIPLLLVSLLVAAASALGPEGGCFDPTTRHVCVSWTQAPGGAGNVTFTIECEADGQLQWCGVGFNNVIPTPLTWRMNPSEAIVLQMMADGTTVALEDRFARIADMPSCFERQVTQLLSFERRGSRGLTATFTRPALLSADLLALGYTNLNRTRPAIAAISSSDVKQDVVCSDEIMEVHDFMWNNTTLAFVE